MQLRHIRPGSLEWQDAKTQEDDQGALRLTPEEIEHLRRLSEDHRSAVRDDARASAAM